MNDEGIRLGNLLEVWEGLSPEECKEFSDDDDRFVFPGDDGLSVYKAYLDEPTDWGTVLAALILAIRKRGWQLFTIDGVPEVGEMRVVVQTETEPRQSATAYCHNPALAVLEAYLELLKR